MKIIINGGVSGGHYFHLARQLERHGCLRRLIAAFPFRDRQRKETGLNGRITYAFLPEVLRQLGHKVPLVRCYQRELDYYVSIWFDNFAAKRLEVCDIFHTWCHFSLRSMQVAKSLGAITVLDRGSSHVNYEVAVMEEEYANLGMARPYRDQRLVNRILDEYTEADYIIVPSQFVADTFLANGVEVEKILKVPYGADLRQFQPNPKNEHRSFCVLFGGAVRIGKGAHYLLEAVKLTKRKDWEVLLFGSTRRKYLNYLERHYGGLFRAVGRVSHGELQHLYTKASVFVLPSVQEGLARVIIEAMACGLPVVATTNTGAAEVIREGVDGFIVPIRDPETIAERLFYLYENQEVCRAMGEAAADRARKFTWEAYGENVVACYRRILRQKRKGAHSP